MEIEFLSNIRDWVYIPFTSIMGLLASFFWHQRVKDRREMIEMYTGLNKSITEMSKSTSEINVSLGRLDERIKTLYNNAAPR